VSIFQPLRKEIERWINRRFFPENREIAREFVELGSFYLSRLETSELMAIILRRVCALLDVRYGAILLAGEDSFFHAYQTFNQNLDDVSPRSAETSMHDRWGNAKVQQPGAKDTYSLVIPIYIPRLKNDEILGLMALGPRQRGRGYSRDDIKGLEEFGAAVGKALSASQLHYR
jgi:hypothetical protein